MKHITISLYPTSRTLKVYLEIDMNFLSKEYPEMKKANNIDDYDGIYFAYENKDGAFCDVIAIDAVGLKNESWIKITAIIAHEVSHCIYNVFDATGIKGDEIQAYFIQYVLKEILLRYDFKNNKIKQLKSK